MTSLGKKIRINKNRNIEKLSRYFIEQGKILEEKEYGDVSKREKPLGLSNLVSVFGSYEAMLKELELGPLAKEVIALKPKPKPKPAVKKPKAPAKPLVVKPAKVKESKDE
ncbi:hypothetical protein N9R80_00240 [bacterium]|nr:hypothetical protein [bacterium]